MLRIGSLFSGVGGLDIGIQWGLADRGIGSRVAWHVEMGEYPSKVLKRRFPTARHCDDVFKVDDSFEDIDLLCGGFPCQPISSAGMKKGSEDERFLWPEMVRIAAEKRPAMVVFENVGNLLKIEDGAVIDRVVSDLHRIGYDVSWKMFSAADIGAPHVRNRVFGLAWRRDWEGGPITQPRDLPEPFDERSWLDGSWRENTPTLTEPSDNQRERAKCLGNAVVPGCARRVGWVAANIWRGEPPHVEGWFPERQMRPDGSWQGEGIEALFGGGTTGTKPAYTEQGFLEGGAYHPRCPWDIQGAVRAANTYPTPAVWAGGLDRPNVVLDVIRGRTPGHQLQLEDVIMLEGLQERGDGEVTEDLYRDVRSRLRSNPEFVEAMMGFPRGWTEDR